MLEAIMTTAGRWNVYPSETAWPDTEKLCKKVTVKLIW